MSSEELQDGAPAESVDHLYERARFGQELKAILGRELTVDNVDIYIDEAVKNLISLVDEVTEKYRSDHSEAQYEGKELEDAAFEYFGLSSITQFLEVAEYKLEQLSRAEQHISERTHHINEVITPPDPQDRPMFPGERDFKDSGIKNRLKLLLYVIQNLKVDLDDVELQEGDVLPKMMRQTSYVTVVVPDLNRVVQVCDEEGNASYMFDSMVLDGLGITVEELNKLTKEEKNELIANHPNVGRRFTQGSKWASRVEGMLQEDFEEEKESNGRKGVGNKKGGVIAEGTPHASQMELDPWIGFWTDSETGAHWGTSAGISRKLSLSKHILPRLIGGKDPGFDTRNIVDNRGFRRVGYSFEEIQNHPHIKELVGLPKVDQGGEWRGFYLDPGTSEHYGAINTLTGRLGVSRVVIEKHLGKNVVPKIKGRDLGGRVVDLYSYGEVAASEDLQKILRTPVVIKEGEWKGFWFDEDSGKHHGSVKAIAIKLGVPKSFVSRRIEDLGLQSLTVRWAKSIPGYSYEELSADPKVKERLSLPSTLEKGEWKNFYVDESGKHWGNIKSIARKLGVHDDVISNAVTRDKLETKRIISSRTSDAYCIEEVNDLPYIQELLSSSRAESAGEWKDFWIDPETGNHWGTILAICRKLDFSYPGVKKVIEDGDFVPMSLRVFSRKSASAVHDAYNVEDVSDALR